MGQGKGPCVGVVAASGREDGFALARRGSAHALRVARQRCAGGRRAFGAQGSCGRCKVERFCQLEGSRAGTGRDAGAPEVVVLVVLVAASCCLMLGLGAVCWRRHAKTRSECGNVVRSDLEGQIEAPVVGKSEESVYISEGASTATPNGGHSIATVSEFGEPVDAVKA